VFRTLDQPFIRAAEPSRARLVMGAGLRGLADLARIRPFATLWATLGQMFSDPRLRQLFGRYATYCGSSPFLAPATLMLVAHVELDGVWLVEGGMARVAQAFEAAARANGASFRYGAEVASIEVRSGRAAGVRLSGGELIEADAVVFNGDAEALGSGLLGPGPSRAAPRTKPSERSLSAVTFCRVARAEGFPLARHTVFFSDDYEAEFSDVFGHWRLPENPTVYVCAQDRDDGGRLSPPPLQAPSSSGLTRGSMSDVELHAGDGSSGQAGGRRSSEPASKPDAGAPERLMLLVNAPAIGDHYAFGRGEIARCEANATAVLARSGLRLEAGESAATSPSDFAALFPGTGGALYGPASHGANASFRRATARTALPGLYLAGGSVHPGPGIPMAALSGWRAADWATRDFASTGRSRAGATPGGISTQRARTGSTD
jgi:1-hydroxycarotenoid 3,4-desaturase